MADVIPPFRSDGYLPEGLHVCSEADLTFRFGTQSRKRRRLILRVRRWIELGRSVGALRLAVDGSFVTAKLEPKDVDAVMLVPSDFAEQAKSGIESALELEEMFATRQPEELFMAEDENDWDSWCDFFAWTREPDGRRKGIVEVKL